MPPRSIPADEEIALLGSSNLDPLSLQRSYPLDLLVVDPATGRSMRAMFENDLENGRRIDLADWARRPRAHRWVASAARLFAPDR